VLGRRHLHGLTEELQPVAIGIKDVDAFGEDMVRRHVYRDPVGLEPLIELAQLGFPPSICNAVWLRPALPTGWPSGTLTTAISWSRSPKEKKAIWSS
jgi:hypothetical protein